MRIVLQQSYARDELAPFQNDTALDALPEPERTAWTVLWDDVGALRAAPCRD